MALTVNERDSYDRERMREHEELVGRTVGGKYSILRLIGRGGMGAVYEGENLAIGRRVAVKFIDREWAKDEVVTSRFAREARAASSIESEHIVGVLDAGSDDGRPYLVMELLRGEDLGTRLRHRRRIPVPEALHVTAQILRGLANAHEAGIVHRDLKPDNVFLVERGEDPLFVKIVDFGISKIERAKSGTAPLALTQRGIVLGTPFYMSPEQAQAFADVDSRADLYSVGAILFECLAGRPPHTGETYEQVIVAICMRDAPDLRSIDPAVPPGVAAFVKRALARDRATRFGSAREMLAALHELAPEDPASRPLPAGPRSAPPETAKPVDPGGPPTNVSWTAGSAPVSAGALSRQRRERTRRSALVIAPVATIAGVVVTIVAMMLSRSTPPAPVVRPVASARATAAATAKAPTVASHTPAAETVSDEESPPAASASPAPAAPARGAKTAPASTRAGAGAPAAAPVTATATIAAAAPSPPAPAVPTAPAAPSPRKDDLPLARGPNQ
jgi:eukaryotic-like serine/threonine-protein kinase